jgi:hypothetical protein
MKGFSEAVDRLADNFAQFADQLRDLAAADVPQLGDGEEPEGYDYHHDDAANDAAAQAPQPNAITDDTMVTLRSGDLRKVIDAYRKFNRFAREGKIMDQDERNVLHRHIKKVKHLIRRPVK